MFFLRINKKFPFNQPRSFDFFWCVCDPYNKAQISVRLVCKSSSSQTSAAMAKNIEIQLLLGPDGKVIFMECGSDFVELMFEIMKAPLSSLVGVCPVIKEDDENALMSMRQSLSKLGKQSFVDEGSCEKFLPERIDIAKIMKAPGSYDPQVPEGYWRTSQQGQLLVLQCVSCNFSWCPHQSHYPNYV